MRKTIILSAITLVGVMQSHGGQFMKTALKNSNILKPILIIAMLFFTAFQSNGQQSKPADSGYAPVNGIKVIW